ncbi:MAG: OmpH family outer membrane protein [Rhodospirillales bacterium]|jgi:outer membrane protein|nr:OmpH family outer membrane protein [Rhodospirillales bacterium]
MALKRLTPMLLSIAIWAVPFSAFEAIAQTPEKPGILVKMAIIDVQAILRNATAVKSVRAQIDKYRQAFQGEIEKEEKEIVNANQELSRQRAILAPAAYNDERRKFENRVADAQRLVQQRKQVLNEVLNQAMGEVQKALNEVITELAKEHGFTLLFRKDQTILVTPELEITRIVLERLNLKLPEVKVRDPVAKATKSGN